MSVNFRFEGHRDPLTNSWKYSFGETLGKLVVNNITHTDDDLIVDVNLEVKTEKDLKEEKYLNELGLISTSTYEQTAVVDIFKKIKLRDIDYTTADNHGNITLYAFDKNNPVYIRSGYCGDEHTPNTYSQEEIETLRKKYTEFKQENHIAINDYPDDLFANMFIKSVELIKNPIFTDFDVYYLYVSNKSMYEELTETELPKSMFWSFKLMKISNFLTKDRLEDCRLYCELYEKENC